MLKDIALKITDQFISNWSACPIIYDNQPAQDMTNEPEWARFTIRFGGQRIASLGDQKGTDQNIRVILQIFVENGSGTARLYELADTFTQIFRYYRVKEATFSIEGMAPLITTQTDGDLLQTNVSIPLRASFIV